MAIFCGVNFFLSIMLIDALLIICSFLTSSQTQVLDQVFLPSRDIHGCRSRSRRGCTGTRGRCLGAFTSLDAAIILILLATR